MTQAKYLALICGSYLFCIKLIGLWPFDYDTRSKRFKFNSFYLIAPIVLVPYIVVNYVLHLNILLDAVKILFKNIVLKMISNVYVSSNVLNLIFLCATQIVQTKKIRKLVYRTINLYENLCGCLSLYDGNYVPHLIKFTIKSTVFAATVVGYMIVSMNLIAPNVLKSYTLPAFVIPVFVNKVYPDIHYGGLLSIDFHLHQINKHLRSTLRNVSKNKNNRKELADISDQLDTIAIVYIELLEIVKEFNRIMSFRVVIWLLLSLLNFLIHLFMQYVFVGIPIRYGHSLNISISLSGLVDLIYQFLEFWLTSSVCNSILKNVNKTEKLLASMYVQLLGYDGAITKSIELFFSRLKHRNVQITGAGLFSLDSTLIFSIVCSSTSYLIILIQFELAM